MVSKMIRKSPLFRFLRATLLWSAFFTATFFVYVFTANAALEFVDSASLCERFEVPKEQKSCTAFVAKNQPDTYVASACVALDDDKLFMDCLKFAATADVDPKALENCGGENLKDAERMACLQKVAALSKSKFQRLPAQVAPAKKAPKN